MKVFGEVYCHGCNTGILIGGDCSFIIYAIVMDKTFWLAVAMVTPIIVFKVWADNKIMKKINSLYKPMAENHE